MKKIFLVLVFVLIAYFGYSYLRLGNTPVVKQDFTISKGDTLSIIPNRVKLSVNPWIYKIWLKTHYAGFVLQAGSYSVPE